MNYHVLTFSLFIVYILIITGLLIWQGVGLAPDRFIIFLFLASLILKKGRSFILDWSPFFFILIAYDFLRGFADNLNQRVFFFEPIKADLFFFGTLPTTTLQQNLLQPANLGFVEYASTVLYFLHFALPLSFGFLLWVRDKAYFKKFTLALLLLSYLAFFTFLVFPVSPPWLASQKGYIPEVTKIIDLTLKVFPDKWSLPTIYHQMNPNQVAAVPSLHAAYPFLVLLFALSFFKLKALPFLFYVLGVWFSIVYLGEHYVVDIVIGAIYAAFAFIVAKYVFFGVKFHIWLKKATGKFLI